MADPTTSFLGALAAVQAEAPRLPKDKTNPHFGSRFTGLDTIVEKIGPLLTKHGLVWIAKPSSNDRGPTLDYQLTHVGTSEGVSGSMPLMLAKPDSQAFGSALTYARRYALCSVLNLVSDDDDDGNASSARPGRTVAGVTASDKQVSYLKKLIKQKGATAAQLNFMLIEVGAQGVQVEDGWTEKLDAGVCSGLLDWLTKRPLPDTENPSDVPAAGPDEFVVPAVPDNEMWATS